MLDADDRNADVIFPYLNGEDLNSHPAQRPSRYVINFFDWPEERAREYRLPYAWIEERVKPERQRRKESGEFALRRPLPERWWQYADKRPALYHAIGRGHQFERHPEGWSPANGPMDQVIGITRVSKFLNAAFLRNDSIFTLDLFVFASSCDRDFALLQSSIHDVWTRKQASTQETRLRYTATDCFETMPLPAATGSLNALGREYVLARSEFTRSGGIGLTRLYNGFHSPSNIDSSTALLRELHRNNDLAVARAYGWDELDLGHGFYEVPYLPENDRVRFTISEPARLEVLRRLAELNRQRYQEEVDQGLHRGTAGSAKARGRRSRAASASEPTLDLEDILPTTSEGGD